MRLRRDATQDARPYIILWTRLNDRLIYVVTVKETIDSGVVFGT